ncbi:MAG: sialidase family protein [Planctomycetaceae bacterium]
MKTHRLSLGWILALMLPAAMVHADESSTVEHTIAAIAKDRFHGWPANNGVWQWGDEILVGFTQGDFVIKGGHNIAGREDSLLSRSTDGGRTWTMFDPSGFLDDQHPQFVGERKSVLDQPIDFSNAGLALRIFSDGYHGNADTAGGFFYSLDRGANWHGPYALNGLTKHPELQGQHISARTDYLVQDRNRCLVFFSSHPPKERRNRVGCMQTVDGGRSFEFLSWVTPSTKFNSVMSQTVQFDDREFVLTYRKIDREGKEPDSIEAFRSADGCRTWEYLSTVKVMKTHSNPPALVKLRDGRLCCAYGDRHASEIRARYSDDKGRTWGPELVIRDDFKPLDQDPDSQKRGLADLGYVRLVQRSDGRLVAMYYWATAQNPQQHIAVSIWKP